MDSGMTGKELDEARERAHGKLFVADNGIVVTIDGDNRMSEVEMPEREFDDQDIKRQFLNKKHKVKYGR